MRKKNTQKIDEVVQEYLKALKIDKKLKEVKLIRSWEEVVGKTVAKATSNIYIHNKVLFVKFNSSVVRNELYMLKEGLKKALNEKAGEEVIVDVVLR